jgi:hypothetical protein
MVAGAFSAAHVPVDAGRNQPLCSRTVQQKMVQSQPCVSLPSMSQIVPRRMHLGGCEFQTPQKGLRSINGNAIIFMP